MAPKKILIVEDEDHKVCDLRERLDRFVKGSALILVARSVRAAVVALETNVFDLIVLDMALPTLTKEKDIGETGGVAQASGGIEVLRMMRISNCTAHVIVVTQCPDIFVSGTLIKFKRMREALKNRYKADVVGVVLYSYDKKDWEASFDRVMGAIS